VAQVSVVVLAGRNQTDKSINVEVAKEQRPSNAVFFTLIAIGLLYRLCIAPNPSDPPEFQKTGCQAIYLGLRG
jgi:hypothetical protein